jgi:phage shock protein A
MRFFKAWGARLWSGLDDVVAELEDHDALIGAALRELEDAERSAKRELERVSSDGVTLRNRLAQERVNAAAWRLAAARQSSDVDALELLRQARRARNRARHLLLRLEEHSTAEGRLTNHATSLRERIETLKRQHQLMRTRTAQAEAMPALSLDPIEELFERWDMTLSRAEHLGDPFDEMHREEEERAVRQELRELRKKVAG